MSDRDLDARLARAAGVPDADLPPLPEEFLAELTAGSGRPSDDDGRPSPGATAEPASVLAARQLVADAREGRRRPRRRRTVLRAATAVAAVAAACVTAVVVAGSPTGGGSATPSPGAPSSEPAGTPVDGITLVAAEEVVFPFALDPAPEGLTPAFSMRGGDAAASYGDLPLEYVADYSSAAGRVLVDLLAADPRRLPDTGWSELGEPAGTATVAGAEAEVRQGDGVVTLLWERPDGRWLWVLGEGSHADRDVLLGVAGSIVDRPQPVGLRFGLAPEGWTVGGYEESRSLDLVPQDDPSSPPLRVSLYGGPGYAATVDDPYQGRALAGPVEQVTIQGAPGRIALADGEGAPDSWLVTGSLPGGPLFLLVAPQELTRDQVLRIAGQITRTP
ncbi:MULTISPECIES: hypothetical protein [unclassified Blastococcus]